MWKDPVELHGAHWSQRNGHFMSQRDHNIFTSYRYIQRLISLENMKLFLKETFKKKIILNYPKKLCTNNL